MVIKINSSVTNIAILILGFQLKDLSIAPCMCFVIMGPFSFRVAKG